ncbi:MAG: cytochrome P450 [Steroidobacteraceae bacterium]
MGAAASSQQTTGPSAELDGLGFAALLARLADRGAAVSLPRAVEAGTGPVPLVVIDRPDLFAAGLVLMPQFARPAPWLRGRTPSFTLVADRPVMLDLGDGSPAAQVQPAQTVAAAYSPTVTEARLALCGDGRNAGVRIGIDPNPAPAPDELWSLPGGTAWVLRGYGPATPPARRTTLRCPLVSVEGFPGAHGFAFSHDVLAQQSVLDTLLARGFDLVVLGLDDGMRPLKENAAVVDACLAEVGRRTPLPVLLLGWSMGGLLCRLGLSRIEARGEKHAVTTLVTWDTPHRGAVTQLGVQWFVSRFAPSHPALMPAAAQLHSPANLEMLMLCLQADGSASPDPRREALAEKLSWPRQPRRVLLSCGRGSGGCDPRSGEVLVHWRGEGRGEIHIRSMGDSRPVGEGSWDGVAPPALELPGQPASDGMPGARGDYPAQAAGLLLTLAGGEVHPVQAPATCQVPTVSALDLDQAPDAPVPDQDSLIVCATDQPHLVIDAKAAAGLVEQIREPFDPERFDPHAPAFLSDPYPTYALFRRFAPRATVSSALWCFSAADCDAVLTDRDTWVKRPPQPPPAGPGPTAALADLPPGLFSSDPPAHDALRQVVEAAFKEALEDAPGLATRRAQEALAALQGSEAIELVSDFALPVPAAVLFDLLGLPQDPVLRSVLIGWQQSIATAHDATQAVGTRIQGATCAMALRAYFDGLAYSHRIAAVPGLVGSLCDSFEEAGLDREQLIATLCDLLVAGYLSTTYLLSNGVNRLLEEPDTLACLRAEPDLIAAAVEELLRLEGPVALIDRVAARDTTLGGQAVPEGTHVALVVASANHDPDWFEAPEELRLNRSHEHLAFGAGIHACVGAPLARIVAPISLRALLDHAQLIEPDGEPQWQTDPYLRGAISLPLRITLVTARNGAAT